MRELISIFLMLLILGTPISYAETADFVKDTDVSDRVARFINGDESGSAPRAIPISNKLNTKEFFNIPEPPAFKGAENCTEISVIGGSKTAPVNQNLKDLANSSLGQAVSAQAPSSTPVGSTTKPGESTKSADTFKNIPDPKLSNVWTSSIDVASHVSGDEFLKTAQSAQMALLNAANEDQTYVGSQYRNMNRVAFQDHINRATENLSEAIRTLDQGQSDLDDGDVARLKNLYMNALDKAQAAKELMAEDSSFKDSPKDHPLAKTSALKDLFPANDDTKSSDAMTDRLLMFNGLPKQAQEKILNESKLKFADYKPFKMKDGTIKKIALLHNGNLFGKSETDCSTIVSSLLQPDSRKANFTTLDFRTMWIYKKRGFFPNPPQYPAQKAKLIRETAEAFTPVDLYEGELLIPGDILVHRLPWAPSGDMFIVKSYNSKNMTAEVIDASQTGKVKQGTFSISIDPNDSPKREVRMGLMGLRLKPTKNKDCKMKVAQIIQR